jgi:hypothetical protein
MCSAKTIISLMLSKDGGQTWNQINGTPFDGFTISEIVVHPTNPDVAWVAAIGDGIFRTENQGQTWIPVNRGLGSFKVMDLAGLSVNSDILYAGTENQGIFKSEDGGDTWISSSRGIDSDEPIHALAIDPVRPNVIYAGSYRSGIFISEDSGAHWRLINDGLLTRAVTSLSITNDGETLYAGTTGGGVFRLSTHDQTYFDSLLPTPSAISPTLTPTIVPTSVATNAPIATTTQISSNVTPTKPKSSTTPFYIGVAIVLTVALFVFIQQKRKK